MTKPNEPDRPFGAIERAIRFVDDYFRDDGLEGLSAIVEQARADLAKARELLKWTIAYMEDHECVMEVSKAVLACQSQRPERAEES
jgi:hypothetical protein